MESPVTEIQDFDNVVQRYWPRILRFVLAAIQDSDVAETLTQDCFWKAYKNRNAFRGDCSMNTWLIKIAINLVRSHMRGRRFQFWQKAERVRGEEIRNWPDRGISPEERASVNEQVQAVWEATKTLSERQRTVFFLRYVEEMDIPEIEQSTGVTESTVNVHLFMAVEGIRKRLGKSK